jgi:hypothetical protein
VPLASTARRFHGWCVTQEAGRRRLLGLKVAAIPSHFTDDEHQRYMLGMVDMTHEHMVCAAGALLRYLETHRVGMELEDRDTPFTIATIQTLSLYARACVWFSRDIAVVLHATLICDAVQTLCWSTRRHTGMAMHAGWDIRLDVDETCRLSVHCSSFNAKAIQRDKREAPMTRKGCPFLVWDHMYATSYLQLRPFMT